MEEKEILEANVTEETAAEKVPAEAASTEVIMDPTEAAKAAAEEAYDIGQSSNKSGKGMGWYVVHTYSGYENNV